MVWCELVLIIFSPGRGSLCPAEAQLDIYLPWNAAMQPEQGKGAAVEMTAWAAGTGG